MKTIRLLYPDFLSGGLTTYYFGANLLQYLIPTNKEQLLVEVPIAPPTQETDYKIIDGIYAKNEIFKGIEKADEILTQTKPDKIITIGGSCIVSLAPFDYLNGIYENVGIVWIDAHPDISVKEDGYPYAHAMVLGSLTGMGEKQLTKTLKNNPFKPSDILYVGLQDLHEYQKELLDKYNVRYKIQNHNILSNNDIDEFICKYDHILVHFDIDVLDPNLFHSTYFANKNLTGDGSGGGKMNMDRLKDILVNIDKKSNIVGFTIAEFLPFDEEKLSAVFNELNIFK